MKRRTNVMKEIYSDELNQLQSFILHQPLPLGVQVLRSHLFGFDRQSRDPSDR